MGVSGHHVPGGLGQLARQRLNRNHRAGPGFLALIPLAALRIVAHRKVRRLHKRPSQVPVPTLGVILPLLPLVGGAQQLRCFWLGPVQSRPPPLARLHRWPLGRWHRPLPHQHLLVRDQQHRPRRLDRCPGRSGGEQHLQRWCFTSPGRIC
jgi:hypothetical protein